MVWCSADNKELHAQVLLKDVIIQGDAVLIPFTLRNDSAEKLYILGYKHRIISVPMPYFEDGNPEPKIKDSVLVFDYGISETRIFRDGNGAYEIRNYYTPANDDPEFIELNPGQVYNGQIETLVDSFQYKDKTTNENYSFIMRFGYNKSKITFEKSITEIEYFLWAKTAETEPFTIDTSGYKGLLSKFK